MDIHIKDKSLPNPYHNRPSQRATLRHSTYGQHLAMLTSGADKFLVSNLAPGPPSKRSKRSVKMSALGPRGQNRSKWTVKTGSVKTESKLAGPWGPTIPLCHLHLASVFALVGNALDDNVVVFNSIRLLVLPSLLLAVYSLQMESACISVHHA